MLLEVLIAFVIASLAIGALYQGALIGLRATHTASRLEEAISRARSRVATAGHGGPLVPGDWRGDDGGGFQWRLRVSPIATTAIRPMGVAASPGEPSLPLTLYGITVWMSWRDAGVVRSIHLDTEQIGRDYH